VYNHHYRLLSIFTASRLRFISELSFTKMSKVVANPCAMLLSFNVLFLDMAVSEQRYILHEIRKHKANWIGHILRRNCLLKEVIEGKINGQKEVTRRRGRRRKKLLDDLGDRRGYSYLKEEALDRIKWRNRFGRDCGLSSDRLLMMMTGCGPVI
jgi:hypothetical protein